MDKNIRIFIWEIWDKNICQGCGRWFSDTMLCGHHIKTRGSRPDLELDQQNGIVLCRLCREEIHAGRSRV